MTQKMRLCRRCAHMNRKNNVNIVDIAEMRERLNPRNGERVETEQFECAISTKQSINKYDTNREDFICRNIVHTPSMEHTERIEGVKKLLRVTMAT